MDDIKHIEDAGTTGTVSLPFKFVVAQETTLEEKKAHLERYAENVIAKVNG